MTDELTINSALEQALEEAQKYGASTDEAKKIHGLVAANTWGPQVTGSSPVKTFKVRFGPDADRGKAFG